MSCKILHKCFESRHIKIFININLIDHKTFHCVKTNIFTFIKSKKSSPRPNWPFFVQTLGANSKSFFASDSVKALSFCGKILFLDGRMRPPL